MRADECLFLVEKRAHKMARGSVSVSPSLGPVQVRANSRDVVTDLRHQPESDSEPVASNVNQLLQRVAGTSVREIDKLITEMQTLRDTLQNEATRVQREIVEYATLSQAALQSTKTIGKA